MLKVMGAVLILIGAIGAAGSINRRMRQHYKQLIRLKELLILTGNELKYLKAPLPLALKKISLRLEEPFKSTYRRISEELSSYEEASPYKVWQGILRDKRAEYLLSEEEFQIFLDAGTVIEQGNGYMQGEEVKLFTEQVNFRIVHAREELETKQRLCRYLCGAGGLFLILILV